MTKEEFDKLIAEQREKGLDDEDIAKVFAMMYKDGKMNREQIEGVLEGMGYEISPEFKALNDEEFKEKILVSNNEDKEEGGKPAPQADKEVIKEKQEEAKETETEEDDGKKEDDEEERKKSDEDIPLGRLIQALKTALKPTGKDIPAISIFRRIIAFYGNFSQQHCSYYQVFHRSVGQGL